MTEKLYAISAADITDFNLLLADWRAGRLGGQKTVAQKTVIQQPWRLAALQASCRPGHTVKARILEPRTDLASFRVSVLGTIFADRFRPTSRYWLRFLDQETGPIDPLETNLDAVLEAIEQAPWASRYLESLTLDVGGIEDSVSVGNVFSYVVSLNSLANEPTAVLSSRIRDFPLGLGTVLVQRVAHVATGDEIDVTAVLPFSEYSPLPSGSWCVVAPLAGIGWGIISCESRRLLFERQPSGGFAGYGDTYNMGGT